MFWIVHDLIFAGLSRLGDISLTHQSKQSRNESLLCVHSSLARTIFDSDLSSSINERIKVRSRSRQCMIRSGNTVHLCEDIRVDLVEHSDTKLSESSLNRHRIAHQGFIAVTEPCLRTLNLISGRCQRGSNRRVISFALCYVHGSTGRTVSVNGSDITLNTLKSVINRAKAVQIQMRQISVLDLVTYESLILRHNRSK